MVLELCLVTTCQLKLRHQLLTAQTKCHLQKKITESDKETWAMITDIQNIQNHLIHCKFSLNALRNFFNFFFLSCFYICLFVTVYTAQFLLNNQCYPECCLHALGTHCSPFLEMNYPTVWLSVTAKHDFQPLLDTRFQPAILLYICIVGSAFPISRQSHSTFNQFPQLFPNNFTTISYSKQ